MMLKAHVSVPTVALAVALATPTATAEPCRSVLPAETRAFLDARQQEFLEARARARRWLDDLSVDPTELRAHGIKGKKKLVELLNAYAWLLRAPLDGEKNSLRARVAEIASVTAKPEYHNMVRIGDREFKQDATSYMRAAYLMDELGLDTRAYREEIRKILWRFDGQMAQRGVHQQMIFRVYYEHFGFEEPFDLGRAFEKGAIRTRADPRSMHTMGSYHLTHEIFVPFRHGAVRQTEFFDEQDLEYLRKALPILMDRRLEDGNVDLVAELVLCMELLDFEEQPAYRRGLAFLLSTQNDDGSWGDYPAAERRYGPYARYQVYLHTSGVALAAIVNAFRCPASKTAPSPG